MLLRQRSFIQSMIVILGVSILPAMGFSQTVVGSDQAQDFIKSLANETLVLVADKNKPVVEREAKFRILFLEAFALDVIGPTVLGRYARQATKAQKDEFQELFTSLQVATWFRRFSEYSGETVKITGGSAAEQGRILVGSEIIRPAAEPIMVNWLVGLQDNGALGIYDIQVEGTSMVLTYRSEYSSVIRNGGGLHALLKAMRKKVG